MNEHEQGFLQFLAEPSKRRIGVLLNKGAKRRSDVRSALHHAVRLDDRYAKPLSGSQAFPAPIFELLTQRGAGSTCYVIGGGELDGKEVPLDRALESICGDGNGAFVSCLAGRLGYFEFEEMKSSFVLER